MSSVKQLCNGNYLFRHSPLDPLKNEIRLVRKGTRKPGFSFHNDGVQCKVEHFALDEAPAFEALSYLWGPEHPTHHILVQADDNVLDETPMMIRSNLFEFLKLRAFDGYIWIDQICIDQDNTVERNHQVQQMAEIYKRASRVLVWLNGRIEDLVTAADYLRNFEIHKLSRQSSDQGRPHSPLPEIDMDRVGDLSSIHFPDRKKQALSVFFNHPYWKRTWIIEEIMLAREVNFVLPGRTQSMFARHHYGVHLSFSSVVSFWQFHTVTSFTKHVPGNFPSFTTHPHLDAFFRDVAFNGRRRQASFNFADLVRDFSASLCQDPRDKVYALQGLLQPEERFIVDYSKSTADVLWESLRKLGFPSSDLMRDLQIMLQLAEQMMPETFAASKIIEKLAFLIIQIDGLQKITGSMWNGKEHPVKVEIMETFKRLIYD